MAILSTTQARGFLGKRSLISDDDSDQLADLIPIAQSLVERHIGYRIEQASYTDFYPRVDADGSIPLSSPQLDSNAAGKVFFREGVGSVLVLDNLPVRSITSIYEDSNGYFGQVSGAFDASTLLVAGEDYFLITERTGFSQSGQVVRRSGSWSRSPGSIKATYSAGYTTEELSGNQYGTLTGATLKQLAELWSLYQSLKAGFSGKELASDSIGDGVSVSYYQDRLYGFGVADSVAEMLEEFVSYDDFDI